MKKISAKVLFAVSVGIISMSIGCQIAGQDFTRTETSKNDNANHKMPSANSSSERSSIGNSLASNSSNDENAETKPSGDEPKSEPAVVLDLRQESNFDEPKLSASAKSAIVQAVYGKDDKDVAVSSMVRGFFTRIGVSEANETAYLLQPGGRRAIDPKSLSKTVLAVFEGNKLLGKYNVTGYNAFLPVTDIDGDGKNEIVMTGNNYQMGIATMWAQIVKINGTEMIGLGDFKTVSYDSCDQEITGKEIKVAEIKAVSTQPAKFETQYYSAPCPTNPDGNRYPNTFKPIPDKQIGN